ncbi:hypothetical protein P2H44_10730 [Albimonas sp. CAU 1670]|uniref:hypothetical protein n=1 Tax=Albimonas sp. CAU 1670 TaxID=3032599 RepID=UPI0023DB3244|nr:hypothetical protein [Albimonas sp. CAU 1670]MDF2233027.1 hypothetical protein [Albimonas sp. CAU 1670]
MNRAEISRSTKEASERWIEEFPKVAAMERDPRGLPIPTNVSYDSKNGKPIFAITNPIKEIELFCSQKCAVTGTLLDTEDVWFVTTPDLAFVPFGLLMDAPMCGEAKDFTLRVCPYFGIRNYDRLSDKQAKAMAPKLSDVSSEKSAQTPSEFVAIKVRGFRGEPTAEGMRYLPSRHYLSVEFWEGRNCLRVIDEQGVRAELAQGRKKASTICQPTQWPSWTKMSLDGSLNGHWPWAQPRMKEFLLHEARKFA